MRLKTGDIVFVKMPFVWFKPLRYVSLIIRKVLKTWFNHIAIIVIIENAVFVAESTAGGVKITPFKQWSKDSFIEIQRNDRLTQNALSRIMKYQGFTGYDYKSLVWYQIILQFFGKWEGKKREAAAERLYCSEYYALVDKESFPQWWRTTPKDIYKKEFLSLYVGKAKKLIL